MQKSEETPYLVSAKVINLILTLIDGTLLLRFVFKLAGANSGTAFIQALYNLTDVLMAPFRFIFPTNVTQGSVFEWSVLVAMLMYALLAQVVIKVISIVYTADTGVDAE